MWSKPKMFATSTIVVNFAWDKTLKCIAEHFWSGRSSVPEPACAFFTILQQAGPRLLGHIQSREHKTTPDKMASLFIGQKVASFIQVNMNSVEEWLQKLSCWSNHSKLHVCIISNAFSNCGYGPKHWCKKQWTWWTHSCYFLSYLVKIPGKKA